MQTKIIANDQLGGKKKRMGAKKNGMGGFTLSKKRQAAELPIHTFQKMVD